MMIDTYSMPRSARLKLSIKVNTVPCLSWEAKTQIYTQHSCAVNTIAVQINRVFLSGNFIETTKIK